MSQIPSSTDVVVIGGGVMGASIALELSKNGRKVVVLDKGGAPGAGSTSASSAIIRFTYSNFNSSKADGVALLYLNGKPAGSGLKNAKKNAARRPRSRCDVARPTCQAPPD